MGQALSLSHFVSDLSLPMSYDYDSLFGSSRSRSNKRQAHQTLAHFVTLIVKDRACVLAEIEEDDLRLTAQGLAVQEEWFKAAELRPELTLYESEFVVMPNHIHGLIRIQSTEEEVEPAMQNRASRWAELFQSRPRPAGGSSLPAFIRAYKSAVNQRLNPQPESTGYSFWERSYEEQLIYGEPRLSRVRQRIQINPYRWTTDPLHPDLLQHNPESQ